MKRGDVWPVNFEPAVGGKVRKERPAVIVSNDDAKAVLEDDQAELYHVETFDDAHSMAEDRHITTTSHPADRSIILLICWTDRYRGDERVTKVISARHATRRERKQYAQAIEGR
jgi:uncharacterized DUF497 family protein